MTIRLQYPVEIHNSIIANAVMGDGVHVAQQVLNESNNIYYNNRGINILHYIPYTPSH